MSCSRSILPQTRLTLRIISVEYLKFAQCDKDITNNDLKCGLVFKRVLNISQDQPSREATDHTSVERVLIKNCW